MCAGSEGFAADQTQWPLNLFGEFRVLQFLTGEDSDIFPTHLESEGASWQKTNETNSTNNLPFETMSKRRRGFPSETNVKRGVRVVHGDKLLEEKLGRNDPCPCGSGRRFKRCCLKKGRF